MCFLKSICYHLAMDIQKTALRLPRDLHDMVIESSRSSVRSMNAEIIARLRSSFSDDVENPIFGFSENINGLDDSKPLIPMSIDSQAQPYSVRLPTSMRRQLDESARQHGRSLHAEILLRLSVSLEESKFGLSERINDLGENDRLTEGQKAEVLELIRQELGK